MSDATVPGSSLWTVTAGAPVETVTSMVLSPLGEALTLAAEVTEKRRIRMVSTCSKLIWRTRPFRPRGVTALEPRVVKREAERRAVDVVADGREAVGPAARSAAGTAFPRANRDSSVILVRAAGASLGERGRADRRPAATATIKARQHAGRPLSRKFGSKSAIQLEFKGNYR